jgi:hypothetical protein
VLVVDFLQVAEVVPTELGLILELLLVGSVLVVDFLRMVEVVPAMLGSFSRWCRTNLSWWCG